MGTIFSINTYNIINIASLLSIAEICFRQLNPEPSDETPNQLAEYIESAKLEYAYRVWERNRQEWLEEGIYSIPPNLLSEKTLIVKDKEADISELFAMRTLPNNVWIQQLGGFECPEGCKYVIMNLNQWKILCDDDSRTADQKAAVVLGKKIKFPDGTFSADGKVPIIYANLGNDLDDDIEVDDGIGALVRRSLIDIYGKRSPENKTNDSNSNS